MITSSEIRAKARAVLGGKLFGGEWLYPVLVCLIVSAISGIAGYLAFLSLIIAGLISAASAAYFTSRVRKTAPHDNLNVLIEGAKKDVGGNIVLGLLEAIFIALWTLLFIIPGIVKAMAYSMAFYIKNDNPNLTATECLKKSQEMMYGHKMKYFMLQLSFIGWYIVGAICLGVGTLWVNAYSSTASAIFYEELCEKTGNKPLYEQIMGEGGSFTDPFATAASDASAPEGDDDSKSVNPD
ncbi:MAG: DUF975 family protein [Clostridia bacterium]|nr:DUF975 family protein [Clostridia bacterium]